MKDEIFKGKHPIDCSFEFNAEVARVFDDMAERSIPNYYELQKVSAQLAKRFYKQDTFIYDLGCSTASTLISAASQLNPLPSGKLVGIDSSAEMLAVARQKIATKGLSYSIELYQGKAENTNIAKCSVVFCNYILQFISKGERLSLLRSIYNALLPGGALLLSEKCDPNNESLKEVWQDLYYQFKERHGYTQEEITAKQAALKNVLLPLSLGENLALLRQAGFEKAEILMKAYHFTSFLCIKPG